ncbi:MFS family permease [Neorhizobium huautlense]|uniref:MFS family permease n=1 Tax=Neorhizobium huautlense TaxID=67774 RepID=A0ABT9Q0J6_9HYPH|nr:MFS transporter [Neorhizobium huautlense]MDP9839853.1 MFS family permease [Neorhizobium huautlense]
MLNLRKALQGLSRIPAPVLFVIGGSFLISVARATSLTFVAITLHQDFAMTPGVIGLVLGTGPLLGALSAPFAGALSDAIGRKPVLVMILGMLSFSVTALGVVSNPLLYCIAYTAAAISLALFTPISRAIISDYSQAQHRLRHFSWRYTASNIGWVAGPIIGIVISPAMPAGFLVAGAIFVVLLLMLATVDMPAPQRTYDKPAAFAHALPAIRIAFRDRRLLCVTCGATLAVSVFSHWQATIGPLLLSTTRNAPQTFAILVSTNGVVVLLANPIARRLVARLGGLAGAIIGCAILCASQIGFVTTPALPVLVMSMIALSIGEVLVVCAEFALVDTLASDANRGSYFGAHAISSAGCFLGPVIGGFSLAAFGGASMFLLFALVAVISAVVFYVGVRASHPTGKQ